MKNLEKEIRGLIKSNKLTRAIDLLHQNIESLYNEELSNQITLVSRNLKVVETNKVKGIIPEEQVQLEKNRIADSLLQILDEVIHFDNRIATTKNATAQLKFLISKIKSTKGILSGDKPFAHDMRAIFDEIDNTYKVVLESLNKYFLPAFDQNHIDVTPYLHFSNGNLSFEIDQKRGHCHIISENYGKLNGVRDKLKDLIKDKETFHSFDELFSRLADGDNNVFMYIQAIGDFIRDESEKVVELLLENKLDEVRKKIAVDYRKIKPLKKMLMEGREDISELMLELGY